MTLAATVGHMGRKRKADDEPKRRTVSLPLAWFEVAQRLAKKRPTPTTWFLCELIKQAAEAAGETDLPAPPWETEDK